MPTTVTTKGQVTIPKRVREYLGIGVACAETSVRFPTVEPTVAFLDGAKARVDPIPRAAPFLGGEAHRRYRQGGGTRRGVLSDFLIGAHAAIRGVPLLTRNPARFRTCFPDVPLITPAEA